MKVSTNYCFLYLAGLSSLASTTLAASCVRQDNIVYHYIVEAGNLPDISGVCGALWDYLKYFRHAPRRLPFAALAAPTITSSRNLRFPSSATAAWSSQPGGRLPTTTGAASAVGKRNVGLRIK